MSQWLMKLDAIYAWLECEKCGQYQTPHSGKCDHCGAANEHLILRTDDDHDVRKSAHFRYHNGIH